MGVLTFPIFDKYPNVLRCGVSTAALGNMAYPGEDTEVVRGRRRGFLRELGFNIEPRPPDLAVPEMGEGERILRVPTDIKSYPPRAEALVTGESGVVLMHTMADCLGLAFASPKAGVVGIAHAGYRQVGHELPFEVVRYLTGWYDIQPHELLCAFAPTLQGPEFRYRELKPELQEAEWRPYISRDDRGYHVRWVDRAVDQLMRAGLPLENICRSPIDTLTSPDFFSHERWCQEGEQGIDGRHAIAIGLL